MKSLMTGLAAIALVSGCYAYKHVGPADVVTPATGNRIQVRLTQQGSVALAQQIGPQAETVQGDVVSADADSLRLAVRAVEDSRHVTVDWRGEQIAIPRDAIASIGQRQLSLGATALLGGVAAGSVIAAAELFSGSGASTGAATPPGIGRQ